MHVQGGKKIKLAQPQQLMAQEREIIDEAYAGDIIGVFDPGIFSIGDTICTGAKKFQFERHPDLCAGALLPRPAEGHDEAQAVRQGHDADRAGRRHPDLPGARTPAWRRSSSASSARCSSTCCKYRLENEYNVEIRMEGLPYQYIRWIEHRADDFDPEEAQPHLRHQEGAGYARPLPPALCERVEHPVGRAAQPAAQAGGVRPLVILCVPPPGGLKQKGKTNHGNHIPQGTSGGSTTRASIS